MSGHCPKCGVYHEEDDDRLCGKCHQKTTEAYNAIVDAPARIAALETALAVMTKDRDAQADAVAFLGGAVRTTRAHVWTETPGVEIQVFADPDVPHSLRLVVRDVHAKEDLASVRVEAFRLDLLCGPIVRLLLEHRSAMAAAVKGGN